MLSVDEVTAPTVGQLNLTFAMFLLNENSQELTLSALLPYLDPNGFFLFFFGEGLVGIWKDKMTLQKTGIPESFSKLLTNPTLCAGERGNWHCGPWTVYAYDVGSKQFSQLEDLAKVSLIKLEQVRIRNEDELVFLDYEMRKFLEGTAVELDEDYLYPSVLMGVSSRPLAEAIFQSYAIKKGLITGDKISVNPLMRAWFGDDIGNVNLLSLKDVGNLVAKTGVKLDNRKKLLLRNPLVIEMIKSDIENVLADFKEPVVGTAPRATGSLLDNLGIRF